MTEKKILKHRSEGKKYKLKFKPRTAAKIQILLRGFDTNRGVYSTGEKIKIKNENMETRQRNLQIYTKELPTRI